VAVCGRGARADVDDKDLREVDLRSDDGRFRVEFMFVDGCVVLPAAAAAVAVGGGGGG
jgi:hypothetical protein